MNGILGFFNAPVLLEAAGGTDRILGFFDGPMLIHVGWQLLNTVIMCFILYKLLYNPVKEFLKNRSERIKGQIASAERNFADAQQAKAQYEKALKEIDKERVSILENANKQALEKEEQIVTRAKEEAETLKKRAMLDIEREQEKYKDEMKNQMIEISTLMASRYIAGSIDGETQVKLLDNIISELGDAQWLS